MPPIDGFLPVIDGFSLLTIAVQLIYVFILFIFADFYNTREHMGESSLIVLPCRNPLSIFIFKVILLILFLMSDFFQV